MEETTETTQAPSGKPSKAGIYPVCNGAECMCDQSKEKLPALLKVISHKHVYINDKDCTEKLIATTNDLPLPFEKQANTFGTCLKQPLGFGQYKPCIPNITKWDKSYKAVKIAQASNGEALLEESEGICTSPGGPGKITFTTHGQTQVVTTADAAETPSATLAMLTDGLLTEEEVETLAKGEFSDQETKEIKDINVIEDFSPDNATGTYKINNEQKTLTFKVCNPKEKDLKSKEKAAINWAVYTKNKNGTYSHLHTFIDQGSRLKFPYRTVGTYAVEAYSSTKQFNIATGKGVAYNLVEIVYQQVKGFTLYGNNENRTQQNIIRPTETTTVVIDALFPDATGIQPKNIYWEVTCKDENIPFQKISDATQITIPPQLNTKSKTITVSATLKGKTESITFKIKKNAVKSITADKDTISILNDGETAKERHKVTFTAHYLLPYSPLLGDPIPKWCVYNTDETPHAKNIIAGENKLTYTGTSNKIGEWHIEAFANSPDGTNATLKAIQSKITKAYWADKNGNSINKSGFEHKVFLHIETQGLQGEQLQPNIWYAKKGSKNYNKQQGNCIEIKEINGVTNQGFTLPKHEKTDNLEYFFTIEPLPFYIEGADKYPKANNEYIVSNNCTPNYLNVTSNKKITSLKIYETGNILHTGIVKYGDTVTIKVEARNYVGKELIFDFYEDVKVDNHTDNYDWWDVQDDKPMNKTIEVLIDEHGKGEQQFSIPCEWEDSHKLNEITPRYFYLKTGDLEFPRAYYVANPNKTEEENKSNSNRIKALMLKVAITNSANDWEESDNAVILGEELLLEENVGERCEPLIWGKKFSCAEREKVIEIAAQLWGENNKLKMANELMGCIALETGGVFTADVTKGDGLGLIQFTGTAVDDMNKQGYSNGKKLTKVMLGNMTVLEQLDYVKLYFDMHISHYKRTIKDAMDMYMCILCPAAVGKDDSFVLYSKEKDKKNEGKNYKKNASIDGEYYKEKGNLVLKGTANDEITRGELKPRLLMWTAKGIIKKNRCKTDASTCEFGTSKGEYLESDLNIPAGIAWLETLHITMQERKNGKEFKVIYNNDSGNLRTDVTDLGEENVDCSELVCRYLQKIEWSKEVNLLNTAGLYNFSENHSEWLEKHDATDYKPKKGDIFLWKSLTGNMGHTGIVINYDSLTDVVTTIEAITGNNVANEASKAFDNKSYTFNFGGVIKCVWKRTEYHLLGHTTKKGTRSTCRFYTPKVHYTKK